MTQKTKMLDKLTDENLVALARIAKNRKKGAYVFFRNPKAMIALREEIERRKTQRKATSV